MAFVYWIHLPEHTDMFSEGYVGFTSKTVEFRYSQHLYEARHGRENNLYNAMRKYVGQLIVETLVEGATEYCLDVENKLRPKVRIGWNLGIGGESTMLGYEHSDKTRANMSAASPIKGEKLDCDYVLKRAAARKALNLKHTDETKEKLSEARKNLRLPPWLNPAANSSVWASAADVYSFFTTATQNGQYYAEKTLGYGRDKLKKIHKHIKNGWNPNEDTAYLAWLTEYKTKECYGT